MLKKPTITGVTVEERQRQVERYLSALCEEIDRSLSAKTLNTLLDSAIMAVKTANSDISDSEKAKFKATKEKLKELLKLLEEDKEGDIWL